MSAVASWSCPTACGLVRGGTRIECTEPRTGSPAVPDCYLISVAVWTALLLITVGGIRRWMRFDRFWIVWLSPITAALTRDRSSARVRCRTTMPSRVTWVVLVTGFSAVGLVRCRTTWPDTTALSDPTAATGAGRVPCRTSTIDVIRLACSSIICRGRSLFVAGRRDPHHFPEEGTEVLS